MFLSTARLCYAGIDKCFCGLNFAHLAEASQTAFACSLSLVGMAMYIVEAY